MHKIIVITGPTAVGKTKLSIELAKKYDGEIINADAVQVYKGLDIGSAKVTEEEKEGIPHHLLDFKEVTEEYTIYHYQKDCREKIKDIQSRNKTPILVGGTGLYIKAALYDYKLSEEKSTNTYDNLTNEELYEELKKLDKDIIIDKDNRRRLIRAINYYKENNESINKNKTNKLLYNVIFIGLTTDRQVLYDKINKRVDEMISQGLLEEVKSFYDKGIKSKPLLNAIGYRELYNYLDGNCTKEEAIEKIKQNSRHYAKRQYTFFNHQLPVVWFETDYNNFNNTGMGFYEACKTKKYQFVETLGEYASGEIVYKRDENGDVVLGPDGNPIIDYETTDTSTVIDIDGQIVNLLKPKTKRIITYTLITN